MKYYTIKSTSDEGIWYLVNGWDRHMAFWQTKYRCEPKTMFRREADAKRSLTLLLKIMPDYKDDKFEMVEMEYKNYCDDNVLTPLYMVEA